VPPRGFLQCWVMAELFVAVLVGLGAFGGCHLDTLSLSHKAQKPPGTLVIPKLLFVCFLFFLFQLKSLAPRLYLISVLLSFASRPPSSASAHSASVFRPEGSSLHRKSLVVGDLQRFGFQSRHCLLLPQVSVSHCAAGCDRPRSTFWNIVRQQCSSDIHLRAESSRVVIVLWRCPAVPARLPSCTNAVSPLTACLHVAQGSIVLPTYSFPDPTDFYPRPIGSVLSYKLHFKPCLTFSADLLPCEVSCWSYIPGIHTSLSASNRLSATRS